MRRKHRLIRLLSHLPLTVHYAFADVLLFPLMYYVLRYRRRVVDRNLKLCFPELTDSEHQHIRRLFYRHFASLIAEIIYGYRADDAAMRRHMVFTNYQSFTANIKQRGGVYVLLSHFGNWEWVADYGRRAQDDGSIYECNVYRRLKNTYFDDLMLDIRRQRGGECVEKNSLLRRMVQISKTDKVPLYGLLADQKPSSRSAQQRTLFFGRELAFLSGGEQLSEKFGYPCYYAYLNCIKRGFYQVTFIPLNTQDPCPDGLSKAVLEIVQADLSVTDKYARLLELNIREQPHLWLWTHNRFKS